MFHRLQQRAVRRLLQLLLHRLGDRRAVVEQPVPLGAALRVVALHLQAQPRRLLEVLAHQTEPRFARRAFELRLVGLEHGQKIALAPRDDRRAVDAAAHRIDGECKLGERTSRDHLCAVDGETRATGPGDALVDAIERRLARVGPLRAAPRGRRARGRRRCGG